MTRGWGLGGMHKEMLKIWTEGRECAVAQRQASKADFRHVNKNSNKALIVFTAKYMSCGSTK